MENCFSYSEFVKTEIDLESFYKNLILKNSCYADLTDEEILILQYRFLCELIFNLLYIGESHGLFEPSIKEINQLKALIKNGLVLSGYKMDYSNKHYVTQKIDICAETIAVKNKDYKECIFDYLIAKTINEKEQALLKLCNQLEAVKSVDNYTKHTRNYIQLLRHPNERAKDKKYAWFYKKQCYSENLENLFQILLTYVAHLNSFKLIEKFDKNCAE